LQEHFTVETSPNLGSMAI